MYLDGGAAVKPNRWTLHLVLMVLAAAAIGVLFLHEPGFGDDFTYWNFAFRLHELGLNAWLKDSFHDLRWPVWGVTWLVQCITGPGLISYYAEPILYLMGGAALAFTFGRMITRSIPAAWACGFAFLFHPLLDTVNYRPMPDLSEGVWGGATILCWWALMRATTRNNSIIYAALTGACIFIAEANRITGVFIIPVLVICTLLYGRKRFMWLIVAGGFAAFFYGLEAAFYHRLFNDWVHDVHANLGNKGHKGTEPIPLTKLPTRFFNSLWKGGHLAQVYCILALGGSIAAWFRHRSRAAEDSSSSADSIHGPTQLAQVMVIWLVVLYLEYACFPQSVHPWRPLIRDADRFLCGLLIPLSVMAVVAVFWLLESSFVRRWKIGRLPSEYPLAIGVVLVAFLCFIESRSRGFFDLGFVPEMKRYMRSLAPGTKVFTHDTMRAFAFLVEPGSAKQFTWVTEHEILWKVSYIEKEAGHCDEFWYARKLVWLNSRKDLEKNPSKPAPELSSFFDTPEVKWRLVKLLAKEENIPDLIFYRRRKPTDPPPLILTPESPQLAGLLPTLPLEWKGTPEEQRKTASWNVPPELRGKFVRIEVTATSGDIETVGCWLTFKHGNASDAVFALKPYLHAQPVKEFFAIQIPADSDHCDIELKLSRKSKPVEFTGFRAVVE